MMRIVITGHASLDHVALLDGTPAPGRTTTILRRPSGAWPRLGGAPAYVAAALAAGGVDQAVPISWIGDDAEGREYRRQLIAAGVPDEGLVSVEGARTPVALLAYVPTGGCICLYDPGMPQDLALRPAQRSLIEKAHMVCLTIGPASITKAVLATIGETTMLAWIAKQDPSSLTPALAARIASRADLIFFSEAEANLVAQATEAGGDRAGRTRIRTSGGKGATLIRGDASETVATEPLEIDDPTGAGDSFAGGVLAALARGETAPSAILHSGHAAAAAMLRRRLKNQNESA